MTSSPRPIWSLYSPLVVNVSPVCRSTNCILTVVVPMSIARPSGRGGVAESPMTPAGSPPRPTRGGGGDLGGNVSCVGGAGQETRQVVAAVLQRRLRQRYLKHAQGLHRRRVVAKRQGFGGGDAIGDEQAGGSVGRRDRHPQVALDDGLARQHVAGVEVGAGQAQRRPSAETVAFEPN